MSVTRVSEFFDSYANDFDAIYGTKKSFFHNLINKTFRKSMRLRFEKVMEYISPAVGTTVLDIGCGPGRYSIEIARKGARRVVGLDVAPSMIKIAKGYAEMAGVSANCFFEEADFFEYNFDDKFDYTIVMGVMDYISDPSYFISLISSLTKKKAFFSFPMDGGFLAWQRKLRYKSRCDLFLYDEKKIDHLFKEHKLRYKIEPISRDYFVTLFIS